VYAGVGDAIDEQLTLIWDEARSHLKAHLNEPTYRLWFVRSVPVDLDDDRFVLGVPNDFAKDWVEKRFVELIGQSLEDVLGAPVDVAVVVDERADTVAPPQGDDDDPETPETESTDSGDGPAVADLPADLNPRYVFDRWVVGPHNE